MSKIFWNLTNEEIQQGMKIMHDNKIREQKPPLPMQMFAYDRDLQRMADMLADCGFDRTLMKLTYADELETMRKTRTAVRELIDLET